MHGSKLLAMLETSDGWGRKLLADAQTLNAPPEIREAIQACLDASDQLRAAVMIVETLGPTPERMERARQAHAAYSVACGRGEALIAAVMRSGGTP